MTSYWWLAASCLLFAGAVAGWPTPGRWQRMTRPARPVRLRRPPALAGQRALALYAVLAGLGGLVLAGPVAALVGGAYGGLAVRAVGRRRAARAAATAHARTLDGLCALAADLRAGLPPAAGDPAVVGDARISGLTRAAWRLAEDTGAPLADLIERIEADARAMNRAGASAAAQAAGARATAWLLAGLPLGGIALGYGIGVDPLAVLLHTPVGAGCAAGAVLLQTIGLAWADRLAGAATPASAA